MARPIPLLAAPLLLTFGAACTDRSTGPALDPDGSPTSESLREVCEAFYLKTFACYDDIDATEQEVDEYIDYYCGTYVEVLADQPDCESAVYDLFDCYADRSCVELSQDEAGPCEEVFVRLDQACDFGEVDSSETDGD